MTPTGAEWAYEAADVDPAFIAGAVSWMRQFEDAFVGHVWAGYARMGSQLAFVNPQDLERSISQLLEGAIQDAMSGDEPYRIQHGPYERETMLPAPAQPPAYDLAFVFRSDPRIMWPLEAKILVTANSIADYVRDVRQEFLTCRYAPFSPSGAMLGYLLKGSATDALASISTQLQSAVIPMAAFAHLPCAVSSHARSVPVGKPYPTAFDCHHIILTFHGLKRASARRDPSRRKTRAAPRPAGR
jgi:hypothetical protein